MPSVAHAPLPACVASAGQSRGRECSRQGGSKHRHGGSGRRLIFSGPSVSSALPRTFKTNGVRHTKSFGFECCASAGEEAASSAERSAPLPPLSPCGMKLQAALQSQPERFETLIQQQLEQLKLQRETDILEAALHKPKSNSGEAILLRRIAEVREAERSSVVKDVLYSSVLSQMSDFNVTPLSACEESDLDWLHSMSSGEELQALLDMQPSQAMEMIKRQLADMTAGLSGVSRFHPTPLPKLGLAQVYRQALLFGYSLQQGAERYSLEMAFAPETCPMADSLSQYLRRTMTTQWFRDEQPSAGEAAEGLLPAGNLVVELRTKRDEYAPQYLTAEAAATAERHAEALCGDLEAMAAEARSLLGSARSVEEAHTRMALAVKAKQVDVVALTLGGVCHLLMQGVTFGRLLRQAECQVDLNYGLKLQGR